MFYIPDIRGQKKIDGLATLKKSVLKQTFDCE
jgi:hypothetical protein